LGAHRSGFENRKLMDDGMIRRRDFLRLTAGAASVGLLAACDTGGGGLKGQREVESASNQVRYREFDGPHTVPESIAREALNWFSSDECTADVDAPTGTRV
jgi:hypothetical protein